jgi:hypothetical protein
MTVSKYKFWNVTILIFTPGAFFIQKNPLKYSISAMQSKVYFTYLKIWSRNRCWYQIFQRDRQRVSRKLQALFDNPEKAMLDSHFDEDAIKTLHGYTWHQR